MDTIDTMVKVNVDTLINNVSIPVNETLNKVWSNNEIWTISLAIIALITTIIIGFYQHKTSKRQILFEERLDRFENQKGEVILTSIIIRYFITFLNAWTKNAKVKSKVKTDIVSVQQFINEVDSISTDLNNLINNPFYIKLIERFPEIIIYNTRLKRTIVEQKIIANKDLSKFALSSGTFKDFRNFLNVLKVKSENTIIFETQTLKDLMKLIEDFMKLNPVLK